MKKMHLYRTIDVNEINKLVGRISAHTVEMVERQYIDDLNGIVKTILRGKSKYKIILLAGPSSSGKTTTAKLLKKYLKMEGIGSKCISLDDFFVDRFSLSEEEAREADYESLRSLDIPLIHRCLEDLITKSFSELPVFDIMANCRSKKRRKLTISDDDLIILEGLHALNPALMLPSYGDRCLKIYISVSASYIMDNEIFMDSREIRLSRRIVRDSKFRNFLPHQVLEMWPDICGGEVKYIEPFKETAQIFIDSCISYEPCIFRKYIKEALEIVDESHEHYKIIFDLYQKLKYFKELDSSIVPQHSILREFIG